MSTQVPDPTAVVPTDLEIGFLKGVFQSILENPQAIETGNYVIELLDEFDIIRTRRQEFAAEPTKLGEKWEKKLRGKVWRRICLLVMIGSECYQSFLSDCLTASQNEEQQKEYLYQITMLSEFLDKWVKYDYVAEVLRPFQDDLLSPNNIDTTPDALGRNLNRTWAVLQAARKRSAFLDVSGTTVRGGEDRSWYEKFMQKIVTVKKEWMLFRTYHSEQMRHNPTVEDAFSRSTIDDNLHRLDKIAENVVDEGRL